MKDFCVCTRSLIAPSRLSFILLLLSVFLFELKLLNRLQTSDCVSLSRAGGDHFIPISYELLRLTWRPIAVLD